MVCGWEIKLGQILIVNSSKISQNFLIDNFITEFNSNFEVIRNIKIKNKYSRKYMGNIKTWNFYKIFVKKTK